MRWPSGAVAYDRRMGEREQTAARAAVEQALRDAELGWETGAAGEYVVELPGTRKLSTTVALAVGRHTLTVNAFVVRRPDGALQVVDETEAAQQGTVLVHDPADPNPTTAFALSRLDDPSMQQVPMGIFRQVSRPTYDDAVREQVRDAVVQATPGQPGPSGDAGPTLDELLRGKDTWTVD